MQKLLVCLIAVLLLFVMVGSFRKDTTPSKNNTIKNSAIECVATASVINAKRFTPPLATLPALARKNIDSLTNEEIESIRTGVRAMKLLPMTDPTSWAYQANIHGTTTRPLLTAWATCQHPPNIEYFLSWHRMYLYFFERILRSKSGNPNLTLPYWDYQTNPALHAAYRDTTNNPLYDGTRFPSINDGGRLRESIMTSFENSINNNTKYTPFSSALNGPHGSVHTAIGGNMARAFSAGNDPVFWLHHANIDRLWEVWLGRCDGRANPADSAWLNRNFTFFDETGAAVIMKGSDILDMSRQLNYFYQPAAATCERPELLRLQQIFKFEMLRTAPVRIVDKKLNASFKNANTDKFEGFIKTNKEKSGKFQKFGSNRIIVEFEGVQVNKLPEGVIEVYVNLKKDQQPDHKSKNFLGLLDLFHATGSHEHEQPSPVSLDATAVASALGLTLADIPKMQISFYVRGNSFKGKEVSTSADIQVRSIVISIESSIN